MSSQSTAQKPGRPPVGALLDLLGRPIAFQQAYARLPGQNALSALLLSQMQYWSTRTTDKSGWFYKTQEEWQREVAMTRTELQTARKRLRAQGYISEKRRGNPAKVYFHVNAEAVEAALWDMVVEKNSNDISSMQESCNLVPDWKKLTFSAVCRNPANKIAGILQTRLQESCKLSTENTTENTTDIKHSMSDAGARTKKPTYWGEDFDYESARLMFSLMFNPDDDPKPPNWDRWANTFRLMRTQDGRTQERITYMIKWIARDEFESKVVLSPDKMRKRFDQLAVRIRSYKQQKERQRNESAGNASSHSSDRQRVRDVFSNPCDKSWAHGLIVPGDSN